MIAQPTVVSQLTTAKRVINNVTAKQCEEVFTRRIYCGRYHYSKWVLKYIDMEIYLKANVTIVNGNTIFDIASVTKTFTTTPLVDMVI